MPIVLSLHGLCTIFIFEGTSSSFQMEGAMYSGHKKPVLPHGTESIALSGPENTSRFAILREPFLPSKISSCGMGEI